MTREGLRQEIHREPFMPLRLHLSSEKVMDIYDPTTAWLQDNALLVVHRLRPHAQDAGGYDVIAYRLIERIEQLNGSGGKLKKPPRRRS
ncbi:MAG TPA: hypothetical protein VGQ99_22500 [Tepidisphaeraceae bacterium]|jgi:hypothetical protein|nr:hypothetical protein [Tepidisphaeraceae bacterium]